MKSRKIAPVIHTIKTMPSMILEACLTPIHIARQHTDWISLKEELPGLRGYLSSKQSIEAMLKSAYQDYIENFSASLISISLNRASFLFYLARLVQARSILDLGSGFSSYVFRKYQQQNACRVVSVDDSEYWLGETAKFLDQHGLPKDGLISYNTYSTNTHAYPYDLGFLDIGNFKTRMDLLPGLSRQLMESNGILVLDDYHVPGYRRFVNAFCRSKGLEIFSLRKITRRRLSHAALVMMGTEKGKVNAN